jgi:hypothetical protein
MNNKIIKIIYWISTGMIAAFILPGIFFLNSPFAIEGSKHLGFPYWFHLEVGIGHFIGALLLIFPKIPSRVKEWIYIALSIEYISALIGHLVIDGFNPGSFMPLVIFAVLMVSYIFYHKTLKI